MGLWDKIAGEFIDVVEFTDDSQDTLVHRFERHNNEIKYGAQLTVREGQTAVFVSEGRIADIFGPGRHVLETANIPVLTTLKGWKHGFQSPFKAEVYFVNMRRFTDQKWGTKNPVLIRDPEFGVVRIRAFGTYVLRVIDPAVFITEIVGTDGDFSTEEISEQMRNILVSRFADKLAESRIPVLDMAANYDELGETLLGHIQAEIAQYGLKVSKLLVENISVPPDVEKAIDERSSMGVIGNLQQYTQFQAAKALGNSGSGMGGDMASGAMGAGIGFAMANSMAQQFQHNQAAPAATPPPLPQAIQYFLAINGQQQGPFTIELLAQQVQNGLLKPDTLAWYQGLANWQPAASITELAPLFQGENPPPIPPGT